MRLRWSHSTFAALVLLAAEALSAQSQPASRTFRVYLRGIDIGSEAVTVIAAPDGWTLRGSGRLGPPLDLSVQRWEARYDPGWKPVELELDLLANSEAWSVRTTFSGTTATSEVSQAGQGSSRTSPVAPDTIVLPNLIFGSFEALASRLSSTEPGAALRAFIAPQSEIGISVNSVSEETIQVPGRTIAARRFALSFQNPNTPVDMDVWTEGDRLLRVDIPAQMLSVVREDMASVLTRTVTMARANDEQITIPANGFSLAATISKPVNQPAMPMPAVVLVSGSNPTDREETLAGIPIFAHLANALADAGFLVVRYDKRGTGQSGGRTEAATLEDFANDARAVVTHVSRRKDVDPRKVSLLGYGEGGWIGLLVASREDRVAALAIVGTPSVPGREFVLEQQRRLLQGSSASGPASQQAVDQQKQIIEAVISEKGWEVIPPEIRRRVDTPLYRSFLLFDPARVVSRTRQPMLVLYGELDVEVAPYHAEQLAQLARGRPRQRGTELVRLAGLNHLLIRASSGEPAEYARLTDRSVSPEAVLAITSWLRKIFAPAGRER